MAAPLAMPPRERQHDAAQCEGAPAEQAVRRGRRVAKRVQPEPERTVDEEEQPEEERRRPRPSVEHRKHTTRPAVNSASISPRSRRGPSGKRTAIQLVLGAPT